MNGKKLTEKHLKRLENLIELVEDEWGEYDDSLCDELLKILGTMVTEEKGTYFSVKGKSYKFIEGDYDMQLKACEECALMSLCDQFIDDYAINVCQTVGADKIGVKGNFQPTPEEELERIREEIETIITN